MFNNQTGIAEFDIFEIRYWDVLCKKYPHIKKYNVRCLTIDQYRKLENVPEIDFSENDCFEFAFDDRIIRNGDCPFASIIVNESACKRLCFTQDDKLAAIAHELGHIVHATNTILQNAHESWKEKFADEVAGFIGLSKSLKSLIQKLKDSKLYSDYQNSLFDFRIMNLKDLIA